jgi:arylsulfatase A-like enzyme
MKRDMYEGGVRTPFLARWPGVIKPNSSSDHIAAFWDVLPTLCDIAGVKIPEDTDGISFLPAMAGKKQTKTHDYLYWEFFEQGGKQAILKGDWKAIRLNVRGIEKQHVTELYNIKTDPAETKNVADENPDLIIQFNKLFFSSRTEFNVIPLFEDDNNKAETSF